MVETLSPTLKPHILVVDDDARLRGLLHQYLSDKGYIVTTAAGAREAREAFASLDYDLMVLDVMMPGENGLDLARFFRAQAAQRARDFPILLLTARAEPAERIEGLEAGADDYLPKPFEPKELLLRIEAILRRLHSRAKTVSVPLLKLGRWVYDASRDELSSDEETLRLTGMEAGLMRVLAAEPGKVISREVLAERSDGVVNDRTIDVQVTRLRRKIEEDPRNARYLVTVRGEGYMLMPDAEV